MKKILFVALSFLLVACGSVAQAQEAAGVQESVVGFFAIDLTKPFGEAYDGTVYELGVSSLPGSYAYTPAAGEQPATLSCAGLLFELSVQNDKLKVILPQGDRAALTQEMEYEIETTSCRFRVRLNSNTGAYELRVFK